MTKTIPESRLRIEIASFWFGPTPSGRVALLSTILLGGDPKNSSSFAARLASACYEDRLHTGIHIISTPQRPSEFDDDTHLYHWLIRVEGRESFHSNFGFIPPFENKARSAGLRCFSCPPYWAATEAALPCSRWPAEEARSHAEYFALNESIVDSNISTSRRSAL